MISLDTKVNLAFFVSVISILWNVVLYLKGKKLEKIRIYDKIYGSGEWLLMYEYTKLSNEEYVSDDKDLELAVREHAKSHHTAQFFGYSFTVPEHIESQEEYYEFRNRVQDEYCKHHERVTELAWEQVMGHSQSPVFSVENEDFREKLEYVFKYVGENLSYFSEPIKRSWHDAQNTTMEHVKQRYLSLEVLNENFCESFEERVEDPYVKLLKEIRLEYRKMTKTYSEKWAGFLCKVGRYWYKIKNITIASS